jgi:hypothetical protein
MMYMPYAARKWHLRSKSFHRLRPDPVDRQLTVLAEEPLRVHNLERSNRWCYSCGTNRRLRSPKTTFGCPFLRNWSELWSV